MLWQLLGLLILFLGNLQANENEDAQIQLNKNSPLFVSLGSHCEIAGKLRENGMRETAFPFDWLLTLTHHRFVSVLNDDFRFFLDDLCIIPHPQHPCKLENHYYEFEFSHDDLSQESLKDQVKQQQEISLLKSKYERRIARFRQLNNCQRKVFFICVAYDFANNPNPFWKRDGIDKITAIQAQELKRALDRYFPSLDFTLVIINYAEENVPKIERFPGIVEFKISKSKKNLDYLVMLQTLQKKNN